jgi:broad specificity phosphatase PhoE
MVTITLEVNSATFDEENGLVSGWSDVRLSQLGMDQSKQITQRYAGQQIDAVFCSDLRRATQTVEIALDRNPKLVYTDWRLRECNYGELAQTPQAEFDPVKAGYIDQPFPGGESYQQCTERIRSFLFDMKTHFDGKNLLLISHPSTQFALEALLNNKPLHESLSGPWTWQPGWNYQIQ